MAAGVTLEVVRGPDAGRKFPIAVGCYRVIGRAYGVMGGTAVVSQGERRRLDVEDQRRIQARAPNTPARIPMTRATGANQIATGPKSSRAVEPL